MGIINLINDLLWTYILVALLLGCAVWFTLRTRFVQFRMIKEMVRLLGDSGGKGDAKEKHISSFQAFAISIASRVGTGNLAGVATAIAVGGPGAVFWMWVIALLGASSSFVESTLAQLYKIKGKDSFIGGPAMMEASASWDICDVGAPGILNGMKNYDIQMLGLCDNEYNTALFVRPDSPQAADPTNPEVWKGIECILPTGTTLQYMFLSYLQSLGLSADDVTITNMDVTPALTAFNAGEGDALCVWNAVAYNAEDSGLVRITDVSELGINNVCGLAATKDAMENKSDLIDLAWMVYYLTWDWCQQSEDNMAQAVELYVESCEDEGVVSNESICQRALDIFACPSPSEAVSVMTTEEEDRLSLADRPLLAAENDLLETMDFFISIGSYTEEDRTAILDKELVNSSVAERCAETLKTLGYLE